MALVNTVLLGRASESELNKNTIIRPADDERSGEDFRLMSIAWRLTLSQVALWQGIGDVGQLAAIIAIL